MVLGDSGRFYVGGFEVVLGSYRIPFWDLCVGGCEVGRYQWF